MMEIQFNSLLNGQTHTDGLGTSTLGNIDKNGRCYHVITQIRDRSRIITRDIGAYRHNLLCTLCSKRNVTIVFSVTMPSHTHDVLVAENWETISGIYRILDQNLTKRLKQKGPEWNRNKTRLLNGRPTYRAVYSIEYLFYLGKYIFDNAKKLSDLGKTVPDSCFWMFEKDHLTIPYNRELYTLLFGLSPKELYDLYNSRNSNEIKMLSKKLFGGIPDNINKELFVNPNANKDNQLS